MERAARPVTVHRLEAEQGPAEGVFRLSIDCSSGTYVRSLAADIGAALGGGAHVGALRRTAAGSFTEAEAIPLDDVGPESVMAPADALRDFPRVTVDTVAAAAVGHGKVLHQDWDGQGPWAVLDEAGALLAVYEAVPGGRVKPAVVLPVT